MTSSEKAAVREFKVVMTNKLRENDHKSGWQDGYCAHDFIRRIDEELNELKAAICNRANCSQVLEEAADVANFAMMIADVYKRRDKC